ncbi:hypothetical protein CTheo_4084 [Ceratobasidium theobromae]|uniref:Uncharacterized protein n=1 Tax=Ceratobasidium theobromae TaxID=1582974 RepID=A0A5N5QLR5_9AGAM|nr:hypothetical protein CTheo_4084 [Ceratobasidium theobromae]
MVYLNNAISLSLLLGTGNVVVFAAAALLGHDMNSAHVTDPSRITTFEKRAVSSNAVGLTDYPLIHQANTTADTSHTDHSPNPSKMSFLGSPFGIDLSDPLGDTIDWFEPQQTIGVLEGALDIVANSEEGTGTVKIGTLGYNKDGAEGSPFELWGENETGSLVFLAPTVSPQGQGQSETNSRALNHSMAMIVARSAPLVLPPGFNLTGLGWNASETTKMPAVNDLIIVHIKAKLSLVDSGPSELCATYYTNLEQTGGDVPMLLAPCDGANVSRNSSTTSGPSQTQIWQYDPNTQEVKPLLSRIKSGTPPSAAANSATSESTSIFVKKVIASSTNPSPLALETAATLVTSAMIGEHSVALTRSPEATRISLGKVRRGVSHRSTNAGLNSKRDEPISSFATLPVVEPYSLVFKPRAVLGTGSKLPRPVA